MRLIERLRQAVAGLFVFGQRTGPGRVYRVHGTVETLGDAIELAGDLLRQHGLLDLRGLGESRVTGVD